MRHMIRINNGLKKNHIQKFDTVPIYAVLLSESTVISCDTPGFGSSRFIVPKDIPKKLAKRSMSWLSSCHAEVKALRRVLEGKSGKKGKNSIRATNLIIIRFNRNHELVPSLPCATCREMIQIINYLTKISIISLNDKNEWIKISGYENTDVSSGDRY